MSLEATISNLVEEQFPAFYKEDGPNFIAFVKAYYSWLEQNGNALDAIRSFPDKSRLDTSVSDFVDHFKAAYLTSLPSASIHDQNFAIKHIQDLYKNKGTTEAAKLLFRLLFKKEIEVYKPGDDVLRASSGTWIVPTYLEVESLDTNSALVGKKIYGVTSKATAIVESLAKRNIKSKLIDILYLSNVRGNFQVDEHVTSTTSLVNSPKVLGSLTSVAVDDGGFGISNGDVFSISGVSGKGGSARVVSTINGSGQVDFKLLNGGSGYNLANTRVRISNTVLSINSISGNTSFLIGETIVQSAIVFTPNTVGTFANLALINGYNSSNVLVGNGQVFSSNSNLYISGLSGDLSTATKLVLTTNSAVNTAVSGYANLSANAMVMATNSTAVGIMNLTSSFLLGGFFRGQTSNALSYSTRISRGNGASFAIGSVSNTETVAGTPIGTILSLSSINPGSGYDGPPMISIDHPAISAGNKYDFQVTVANTFGSFAIGQSTSANGVAAKIRSFSNSSVINLTRLKYADTIANGVQLISYYANGFVSGTATIVGVANDTSYPVMGNNAIVDHKATSLSGVVNEISVIDSGFAYRQNESLTLTSVANSSIKFTGLAQIRNQGKSQGFWKDNSGKLDSDKYLSDNNYYQDFSYEIRCELSLDKYAEILKQIFHVAGTKMFGKVVSNSGMDIRLQSSGISIIVS